MENSRSKRLSEIKNDFERGVFLAVYNSRKQRHHRLAAGTALALKHALRGVLFSWPLYLLALAAFAVPGSFMLVFYIVIDACGICVMGDTQPWRERRLRKSG